MPGTLKCHGVVRELKEVGERGGIEKWEAEACRVKKRNPATPGSPWSLSVCAGCSCTKAAKANQMQRGLLCATMCQVQAGSAWGASVVWEERPLCSSDSLQMFSTHIQQRTIYCSSTFFYSILKKLWNCHSVTSVTRPNVFLLLFTLTTCSGL